MDFKSVLSLAKDNKRYASNEIPVKRYSTEVPPPKKSEKTKVQSDAIRSFLAKKQKDEEVRAREAERRKQDLLELRAIAKHNRKATQMAKRTKDNNFMSTFSTTEQLALEAAAAAAAAAAEKLKSQDTSDRYRYFKPPRVGADPSVIAHRPKMVSLEPPPQPQMAQPVRSHNSHRVRSEPPQSLPRRPLLDSRFRDSPSSAVPDKKDKVPVVKRPAAPPPPNFYDLLKLAAKKQHEPVDLPKIPKKTVKDTDVQGRLMTSDEKRRFLEEQTRKQGRSLSTVSVPASARRRRKFREHEEREEYVAETLVQSKSAAVVPPLRPVKSNTGPIPKKPISSLGVVPERTKVSDGDSTGLRITKVESLAGRTATPKGPFGQSNRGPSTALERDPVHCRPAKTKPGPVNGEWGRASCRAPSTNGKLNGASKFPPPPVKRLPLKDDEPRPRLAPPLSQSREAMPKPGASKGSITSAGKRPLPDLNSVDLQDLSRDELLRRCLSQQELLEQRLGSRDNLKSKPPMVPKQFPPRDLVPKQFPPRDLVPKQFPSRDLVPKRFPPDDGRRPPPRPVKRRIESDDEYDAEMDDFIDDGPFDESNIDYSQHIKEIFGYDRSRYQFEPEDDCAMESSFTQMMREEAISTKMGILEDLEDIRREQLELERKAQRIKKKK